MTSEAAGGQTAQPQECSLDGKEAKHAPGRGTGSRPVRNWLRLAGLCLPVMGALSAAGIWFVGRHGQQAECRRRMEILSSAAERYADAHDGAYPYGLRATEELLLRYIRRREFLLCPATRRAYCWTAHARRRSDPKHLLLAWERPELGGHGLTGSGRHVLFVGGRVELIPVEKLNAFLAEEARVAADPPKLPAKPRPGVGEPSDSLPAELISPHRTVIEPDERTGP